MVDSWRLKPFLEWLLYSLVSEKALQCILCAQLTTNCSTHLIDLGLRVENANKQPKALAEGALTSSPHIQQPNRQWQKLLTWALESHYLMRYLVPIDDSE